MEIHRDCLEHLNGSVRVKPLGRPPQFIQFCHHPYHLCLWSSSSLLNSLFGTFHSCSASVFVCFERSPGYGWPGAQVLRICWRPLHNFSVKKNSPFSEHLGFGSYVVTLIWHARSNAGLVETSILCLKESKQNFTLKVKHLEGFDSLDKSEGLLVLFNCLAWVTCSKSD